MKRVKGVMVNFKINETSMIYRFLYNPAEKYSLILIYEMVSEVFSCVTLATSMISDIKGVLTIKPNESCIIERIERTEQNSEDKYMFDYRVQTRDEEGKKILDNLLKEICDARKIGIISAIDV